MIARADRRLGKYEIRQKLGRGGMADVYLAQDTESGQTVALKIIEHSADQDTRDSIEAERRGAELQAQLAAVDPRVVRIFDSGDLEGYFFVAMEYIDGQDLAELMGKGPLTPEFAADAAVGVAETLENAHTLQVTIAGKEYHGIVHGDIKPKNIRVDSRGEVRVLDFGIAKALSLSRRLTRNEFGSVPYASPERLDSGDVNAHSDLWSLAVMVYEMITGMQPYHADNTERLERMIRSRIPPPPPPDPCPEPLRRILIKAMAPDPDRRYASARDFADDLIAYRLGAPVKAVSEDLDSTRRTTRVSEETRRTSRREPDDTRRTAPATAQSPRAVAGAPQPKPRPTVFRSGMRVIAAIALACILYGTWAGISNYLMYQHGRQLARDIESEQLTDADKIWTRWTELSKGHSSSLLLHGARKAVKQKLVDAADHVIATYRNSDSGPVYEKDWVGARDNLARALAADPDDTVRGKLRLCEGHIARINGTSHRNAGELNVAADKLMQAQQLMPKSPDPELALARLYVYGLKNIDKAYEALQRAEKRGYKLGNREKMQLADGYRERADRLWWDSRNVRGLPQERDQIERASEDYDKAMDLYQAIAPYGNAAASVARVQTSLESVNSRIKQIDSGQGSDPTIWR